MPTGYTSDLYDGKPVTFPEFALRVARGMGALITMRDESMDAPIPDQFVPSDYHARELENARQRLAEAQEWTLEEAQEKAEADYQLALARHREVEQKQGEIRQRYRAMLAQVEAWKPPTKDHQGLKDYMAEQLVDSIRFDCENSRPEPSRLNGFEFKLREVERAQKDIAYHTKGHADEVLRAQERTNWVRALKESLGVLTQTPRSA